MKHKIKLKDLKITSFTTTLIKKNQQTIQGGTGDTNDVENCDTNTSITTTSGNLTVILSIILGTDE